MKPSVASEKLISGHIQCRAPAESPIQDSTNDHRSWISLNKFVSIVLRIIRVNIALVPFTRKRKLVHLTVIKISCIEVKQDTEVKYLGITLDQ